MLKSWKHLFFRSLRVRLAEKNYVGTCLTTGKTNHQFLLAWLAGAQREPIAIQETQVFQDTCSMAGGAWQLGMESYGWTLAVFLLVEGEYYQCPPWYRCLWGQGPCEDSGLELIIATAAFGLGPGRGTWVEIHELVNVSHPLEPLSLRPQPTLCLNHCWRWPPQEDSEKAVLTAGWLQSPPQGRVHPEETRIRNSKKRNYILSRLYICIYVLQIEYIYIYILKYLQNIWNLATI